MKLIMTKGLIASGKSTWSKQYIKENPDFIIVCKDDIREELNLPWSKEVEKTVIRLRDKRIMEAFDNGKSVISADTNFEKFHENRLRDICNIYDADFEIKLFDTPLEVCIDRDSRREKPIGKDKITKMYNHYLKPKQIFTFKRNERDLISAIICDIDGTLAINTSGRSPFDESEESLMSDSINPVVSDLLLTYFNSGRLIIFVSGRHNKEVTKNWINKYLPSMKDRYEFFCRGEGDFRKDSIIKKEIYDNYIKDRFFVEFVLDDRNQVCDMWVNDCGLYVLNCNLYREIF